MSISSATSSALQSTTTALNAATKKMTQYESWQELLSRANKNIDAQTNIQIADANAFQNSADINKDGVVSKDELTDTLNQLNNKQTSSFYSTGNGEEVAETIQNSQFAQQLLSNFDTFANLDGKEGISRLDIYKLSAEQGNTTVITGWDLLKAISPDGYYDMLGMRPPMPKSISSDNHEASPCPNQPQYNVFSVNLMSKQEELATLIQKSQISQQFASNFDIIDNFENHTNKINPAYNHKADIKHPRVSIKNPLE